MNVHKKHVQALEKALRCLDNDALASEDLDPLKDDLEYYLVGHWAVGTIEGWAERDTGGTERETVGLCLYVCDLCFRQSLRGQRHSICDGYIHKERITTQFYSCTSTADAFDWLFGQESA